jgi:copper(I)-binding protein
MNRFGQLLVLSTALAVSGCATARRAPVPSATSPLTGITATAPDHSVALRELYIAAPESGAYPAGGSAALSLQLWNNTDASISLTGATVSPGGAVVLHPPGTGFDVAVPAGGHVALTRQAARYLEIRCLPADLRAGGTVAMTFGFDNGAQISTDVPVGPVADAVGAPRSTAASATSGSPPTPSSPASAASPCAAPGAR